MVRKNKLGFLWAGASILIFVCLAAVFVVPTVVAQQIDSETENLLRTFENVFLFIQKNYVDEVDPEILMEGALEGLFESLDDPHSAYLTQKDMGDLTEITSGEFGGVGLYISKQVETEDEFGRRIPGFVEVISPIEGTPAYREGIISGDLIVEVEGESTAELSIDEVVRRLKGRAGTTVRVTIRRGKNLRFDVEIQRAMIQVPTVRYDMMPEKIAYIRISNFTPYTDDKVRDALLEFQDKSYEALVLDVRNNGGGLLDAVVDTADLFFSGGTIVSTRSRIEGENKVFSANRGKIVSDDIPIAVLIDNGSASASEILAGVMKDRNRATIVGEKSYGKGSVQQIRSIGNGGFRLTMSRYYTPSGRTIDKVGIEPDQVVEEQQFSEVEIESYSKLLNENTITAFVQENNNPEIDEIDAFVDELIEDGILLEERLIRQLIKNEINRRSSSPPVYNLEFDDVLQEAVKILKDQLQ